ncbi:MAG: NfeD family protein [Lachnospiraceae bacterium]|nr:NfeD family protein [Lachnospiraceae bacterium]
MNTIFWLIVVAVMLVIEIFTMGLTTIWFSLGAVAAAIAAGLGAPLWVQILLFSVVSILVMVLVRPFAVKVVNKERIRTNIEEVVGAQGIVIEEIDNRQEKGTVRLRGVEWMARSTDGEVIAPEELVTVEAVSGVKLIVKKSM